MIVQFRESDRFDGKKEQGDYSLSASRLKVKQTSILDRFSKSRPALSSTLRGPLTIPRREIGPERAEPHPLILLTVGAGHGACSASPRNRFTFATPAKRFHLSAYRHVPTWKYTPSPAHVPCSAQVQSEHATSVHVKI